MPDWGCTNVDAPQFIPGGNPALPQLGDLRLDLAQLLDDLCHQILIEPRKLNGRLGLPPGGLRCRGFVLAQFALKARFFPLQGRDLRRGDELLCFQIRQSVELIGD